MSDIDFDELDKAVTGALNGKPVSKPVEAVAEAPAVPEPIQQEPATVAEVTETPTAAPAARRSTGPFMDMVHPSSDMRTKPENNVGIAKPVAEPVVALEPKPAETSWNEPLESPFLPDAKVEKRPLGGGVADAPEEELLEAPEPQELLEAASMPDPIDFAAATAVNEELEAKSIKEVEPEAPTELEIPNESTPEAKTKEIPAPEPISEEPVGPTSITQQYKEQPSSNQESGAIYDTESYHQPVAHPVKKKSGLLTVIWIILLIILGAAAGWAVYTFVLPSL